MRCRPQHRRIDIPAEFQQDLPDTSDESLLATLGSLASGFEDDGDILSSGILDFLPVEVQFEDPPLKVMIEETGAMLESYLKEVEHKHKFHRRRLVEVIKARESCCEKSEESKILRERLQHAKASLNGKLEEEYLAEQRIRWSIDQQVKQKHILTERLTGGVRRLEIREDELVAEIAREDELQASLMRQLQESTDEEERLRSTLESAHAAIALERVRDEDRRAALSEERATAKTSHNRLRAELSEVQRSQRSSLDAVAAILEEDSSHHEEDTSADESEDAPELNTDERIKRAAQMERRCRRQQEYLAKLREQIQQAELSTAEIESHLDQVEAATAATADILTPPRVDEADAADWVPDVGEDVVGKVREVDAAVRWLSDGADGRNGILDEHRRLQGILDMQAAELSSMQETVMTTEESCEACSRAIEDLTAEVAEMTEAIGYEREVLRNEEWESKRRVHVLKKQVDEDRSTLQQHRDACRDLLLQRGRKKKRSFSAKKAR